MMATPRSCTAIYPSALDHADEFNVTTLGSSSTRRLPETSVSPQVQIGL